jgi:hypothetical protein
VDTCVKRVYAYLKKKPAMQGGREGGRERARLRA